MFETETEIRRKKLLFRAWHRGTREMDLLLGSFAEAQVKSFDDDQLDQFEKLLENPDPDLYDWKSGRAEPTLDEQGTVMTLFLAHQYRAE